MLLLLQVVSRVATGLLWMLELLLRIICLPVDGLWACVKLVLNLTCNLIHLVRVAVVQLWLLLSWFIPGLFMPIRIGLVHLLFDCLFRLLFSGTDKFYPVGFQVVCADVRTFSVSMSRCSLTETCFAVVSAEVNCTYLATTVGKWH